MIRSWWESTPSLGGMESMLQRCQTVDEFSSSKMRVVDDLGRSEMGRQV